MNLLSPFLIATSSSISSSRGFCIPTIDGRHARFLRGLLPLLALGPGALALVLELVAAGAELGDGLLGEQLLQRPLLDVLRFVFFELRDELHRAREDAAFVLLAAGDDFGEFVDAFVDRFAAAALDCERFGG